MEFFILVFNTILYKPLFNALVLIYQYLPGKDFGIAVILLTLMIRFLLYPLMVKSIRSQKELAELQPKIQEIQKKYKDDKEKQTKETMELYRKEKINPFGGCLPFLLQLPILIALYRVFWSGMKPESMQKLYSFVPNPGVIDPTFLGFINLGESNFIIAGLAGVAQFFQSKTMLPKTKGQSKEGQMSQFSNMMQKQMLYFFPIITVVILLNLPSAIGIYWIVTALFSVWQQQIIMKKGEEDKSSSSPQLSQTQS
ncbi:MAG: YidC/Oxa1 family membrane protein insertase [Candidatus Nealsonbacteria bacterium]